MTMSFQAPDPGETITVEQDGEQKMYKVWYPCREAVETIARNSTGQHIVVYLNDANEMVFCLGE